MMIGIMSRIKDVKDVGIWHAKKYANKVGMI